jgi:hypothetical protein
LVGKLKGKDLLIELEVNGRKNIKTYLRETVCEGASCV